MEPLDSIEKWISEHASARVLRDHVELLKSQMALKDEALKQKDAKILDLTVKLQQHETLRKQFDIQKPADTCPFCRRATGQLIEIREERPTPRATLTFKNGYYQCSNPQCGKKYEKGMG